MLKCFGIQALMSRHDNHYNNVPMESFWVSLKTELTHHQRFATHAEAKASITEWVKVFYNQQRRHTRLGNVASAVFARQFYHQTRAV